MKKQIRAFSFVLAIALCLGMAGPALASERDFDVRDGVLEFYDGAEETVIIPGGITAIGASAFAGNNTMTNVVIPAGVTTIQGSAFYDCTALKKIVIPDSVTSIGMMAFQGCTALEEVVIGNGITYIPAQAFMDCTSLKKVDISNSVVYIGSFAFGDCTSLTAIKIPDSVVYMSSVFYGCSNLEQITLSQNTNYDNMTFEGCVKLPESYTNSEATYEQLGDFKIYRGELIDYTGNDSHVTVPDSVVAIGQRAFQGCTTIKSVDMGKNVVAVDTGAFSGCTNLESVTFHDSVVYVGEAFSALSKHTSINHGNTGGVETTLYTPCANLKEIKNYPDKTFNDSFEANEKVIQSYPNPDSCIVSQSNQIVALSNQICSGISSNYEKAKAIYTWMAKNIEYDYAWYYGKKDRKDPSNLALYPEEVINSKLTVCDGYARLTQALLQAQGIPALYVNGATTSDSDIRPEAHAWNVAWIDGKWVYIDSTWGRAGNYSFSTGTSTWEYDESWFDPAPAFFALTHGGENAYIDPNSTGYQTSGIVKHGEDKENTGESDNVAGENIAYATSYPILVDGQVVNFDAYALKDANGNDTNYLKLRDVAYILNGKSAQFNVGYDGSITITTGAAYQANGSEMSTPFSGNQPYQINSSPVKINGKAVALDAIRLEDAKGGGFTYFKLRDLGMAIGFKVDWNGSNIVIETR